MADKIDALFSDLQSRGFAKDKTIDEFRSYMLAPGEQGYRNRKDFFDDFKGQGMTDLNSYEEFANLLGLRAAKKKPAQPAKAPAIPTQLDLDQAHQMGAGRGPISWEEKPTKKPEDESALEKARRIFGGGATPEENQRTQKRLQQRTDEIAYEQETGNRMRQPVLNPDFEAPVIARDDYGNVRYDENGNIMQGFSTDPDVVQSHQQVVGEQQEWDAFSDEEKRERAKQIENEIDYLDYQEPTMFESFYKGLGSGMLNAGIGLLNVMDQLASGQIVEDASSPTGFTRTKGYDPNDTGTGVGRVLKAANEAAESLSRQAQPNRGQGFLDMLWDGNLTGVLQKGVATATESLPMTLSAYNPYTMVLNGISMAGNNFREQTLENPDVPMWKRASMAIGSAAIEQIVEKYSDPVFKYIVGGKLVGKAAKEVSQEITNDVTKKATESIAKRIFNRLVGLGKDAAGEGAEEIISNFGNDTLGEALDLLDGEKNYGIRAQWEDLKKRNPNADLWDFALQKGKEYTESFIGGALAGFYTSGTTQVSAKALEYSLGKMVSQEEIEQNPGTPIDPVTMEVAQAYDDGYTAEDANQRKNFNDEAIAAAEVLPKYGDEFAKMVTESENPVETMGYLMENRDYYTNEQIEVAADYFQKKAAADGMMDGVLDQIDQEVEYANAEVVSNTHQQTGNVIAAQIEDGAYYVIGGTITNDPETGMPIVAGNGGAVVVKDAQTGEVSVKNPQDVRIVDMQSADDMLAYNNNVLRQQLMQQADEDITYGAPANEAYQIEDVVTLRDEKGNTIEGTIVQEPNAVDGVYVVQTADNRALQLTADEMNRRILAHNGVEVQRATSQPVVKDNLTTELSEQPIEQNQPENVQQPTQEVAQVQPEATQEQPEAPQEPQSALSRIPVRKDAMGNPFTNKKGKPILDWHKASVEDAAAALIETTGGNMIMARDTASDLVKQGQQKLEKIRKQQPKGDNPIEMAESRMEIQKEVEEQQAINTQWQNVNQHIQKLMREEQQRAEAEREAAKSEEQKAREAEEKRQLEEKRRKIDEERRAKKREEELAAWNKPYAPLAKARKELAGDPDALAILDDVEPRSLEEWVSASLRPHSIMWDNEEIDGREVTGLQAELGLQKKDIDRIGTLVVPSKKGGKPFGTIVHEIWEDLPDGMRNMYDDQDVRNALIGLFGDGDALRMRHLAEENRIQEARDMARENQERAAEAELEAWAEAYNLNPEERAAFEEYMQLAPSAEEQEIINNIIYDESYQNGTTENREPDSRGNVSGTQRGESQVQQEAETAGNGDNEEQPTEGREAEEGKPSAANNNVPGREQERVALANLFDQIGADTSLASSMSDANVVKLTLMVENWEAVNDAYGEIIERERKNLQSKNKKTRDAAQKRVDAAQAKANKAFEPIDELIKSLTLQNSNDGAIPTPTIDKPRFEAIRQRLSNAYAAAIENESPDTLKEVRKAAKEVCKYVDEGLDDYKTYNDGIESYSGNDPDLLADQYITRVFQDRYLDYDDDKMYIETGLKTEMRKQYPGAKSGNKLFEFNEHGVAINPNIIENRDKKNRNGYKIETALTEAGWVGGYWVDGPTWGPASGASNGYFTDFFATEEECIAYEAQRALDYILHYNDSKMKKFEVALQDIINKNTKKSPAEKQTASQEVDNENEGSTATAPDGKVFNFDENGVCVKPNALQLGGDNVNVNILTAYNGQGWVGSVNVKNRFDYDMGTVSKTDTPVFQSESECRSALAAKAIDELKSSNEGKEEVMLIKALRKMQNQRSAEPELEEEPVAEAPKAKKPAEKKKRTPKDEDFRGLQQGLRLKTPDGTIEIYSVDYDNLSVFDIDEKGNRSNGTRKVYTVDIADGLKNGTIKKVSEEKKQPQAKQTKEEKPKAEQPKATKPAEPQHNRLVSDEKMEELRKKLIEKMNNLNAGIDPELMIIGGTFAVGKIERGFTKFADYAKEMVRELGDAIRPYLKAFYETVRQMPGSEDYRANMDSQDYVNNFDVLNFDKDGKVADPIAKAEHVVKENNIKKKAKKIKADQPDLFAGDLFADQLEPAAEPIGKTSTKAERKAEEAKVDTNPTEAKKEAGNYQKGHIWVDGHDVTIENPKGSIRRGTDANGKEWQVTMNNTYGYIKGTEGVDGDHIDVFLSDNPAWGGVYVVDQVNPDGSFDEHKVMYGFPNEEAARKAYLSNYSKEWKGLGTITEVSREDFKTWINSSHRKTKPFADYRVEYNPWIFATRGEDGSLMRRAIDADIDNNDVQFYYNGKPVHILLLTREGEQVSAAQFSKPKVVSVTLTNGKSVKPNDLWVKVNPIIEMNKTYKNNHSENGRVRFYNVRTNTNTGEVEYVGSVWEYASANHIEFAIREKDLQNNLDNGTYVLDENAEAEPAKDQKPKGKTAWWSDPNRPKNLDPKDYKTYTTDEAKEYFANFVGPLDKKGKPFPDFTKWAHPNLAYITAAAWDGAIIPLEELKQIPEIQEADARANSNRGTLVISDQEEQQHIAHLLDAEHGSAVYKDGKKQKGDYSGPVRQERKAFVVIGRPAGGKSSVFADPLSHENGARIIDSDVVKPWLEGYDDGYGAGYVQNASAEVAQKAIYEAAKRGDNMVIPRIGGNSVISKTVIPLIQMGYDVKLYCNDVSRQTSVMRAASRFAEEGRYLSLDYLTGITDKISKFFSNFAEKKLGEYYAEQEDGSRERTFVRSLAPDENVLADGRSNGRTEEPARDGESGRISEMVSEGERNGRNQSEPGGQTTDGESRIFSYVEWKSNDVAFGEKPKEIWNSESGKSLSETLNDNDNAELRGRGLHEKRGEASQGAGEASRGTESSRTGSSSENDRNLSERPTDSITKESATKQTPKHNNKHNNVGERGKDYAPTTLKARFNANVEAIKLMRALIEDGVDAPTKDQMEALRQYSGWGGMGTFFNDERSEENKILRDLLTEEEYNDAAMSINSAYYTPAMVIDTLWDIAEAMGFKGGDVLEGSAGIGNIIGQMPKTMSSLSNIEAVEIDSISGNILKLLYPDAKVHIQGFQDTMIPNGSVDLAITNVPFVTGLHVIDKVDKDLSRKFKNIHDFCIAKNIRKLREGGIGLFITSSGTMDKSTELRAWIADEGQADVVGAFRLNNETFKGTTVTSDIIVVRKRTNNQKSPSAIDISAASPIRVGTYEDKFHNEHQVSMVVNDYFKQHPEMMAGEMAFAYEKGETFRPGSYGLYPVNGMNQDKMLADFARSMSKAQEVVTKPKADVMEEPNQLTAVKEGRMLLDNQGRLCISRYGTAVPLQINNNKIRGKYTKEECFKDYQAVQKAVDDVLQQQLNSPDDAALKPKLDALNKAFDNFVKKYGELYKNIAISFLKNDIDYPSFESLVDYKVTKDINGKETVSRVKLPIFSDRVLGFKTEPKPKSVKDALIASIFMNNGIDLSWIAEKLNDSGVKTPDNGQWTENDVKNGIIVSRLGFEDPSTGQMVVYYKYLSGNVREKLAIAESYNTDGKYNTNVEELRKVVPMDIPAHLIDFSLGSSWIPMQLYQDYLRENFDVNGKLTKVEGSWSLEDRHYRSEKNRAAGVYSEKFRETIYGHQIVMAAFNNRPIKVQKQEKIGYGRDASTRTITDKEATQACAVRMDEIKDEFRQWVKGKVQADPELSKRLEKIYNDKFNALVPMNVDEEFMPEQFEGANTKIHLYDYQRAGVLRCLTAPTMLAHVVGAGKSFTMITAAMEMRRLGTARKPMLVVQNATVAQMASDAKLLYPNAKVLALQEKDRNTEGRRAFYASIKYNDWDLIIIPQSTFERIPDSPERELQFIQEKIDEKKHVIEAARAAGADSKALSKLEKELEKIEQEYGDKYLDSDPANGGNAPKRKKKDAKREAASLDKAETRAKEMLDRAVDDVQNFDDLGIDALLVDEAHEYKHLGFQTSIERGIKGVDPSYSKKCAGLYNKTRAVFEKSGWKNVVFATGTPISNTAAEIWTFMKYLMPADVMKQNDIYYFDDFVHNFGAITQMLEFATSGKFKENTRFAAYMNRPELIRIWMQVAHIVNKNDLGTVADKLPKKENGKDQDVFLPQSQSLVNIMAAVRAELERFENMDGKQKKENSSIPIVMYGIAKRAAIDPRLVSSNAIDEPQSKTNAAVKEIVKDLATTKDYKGTVAVFCDNQNRKADDGSIAFNIYDDMKQKLIKAGVPEKQIAIIKSGMSINAKQKVFDAVNAGDIRVVLGSTQTLGTGVNMQERLHLLIHMDAPDRPMDYTQRNGRIERQGNLHKDWGKPIRILRFGVEDSLDVTAYQRLKTKSGFIDSIMDGKSALANNQVDRTVEEEEEGLFDNPVAVLSGSQYALLKNKAERELRKYQGKKAQWEADQIYITNTLRQYASINENAEEKIKSEESNLANIKRMFPDGKVKTINVEGTDVDMTKGKDSDVVLTKVIKEKVNDPVNAVVKAKREKKSYGDETLMFTVSLDGHAVNFKVLVEPRIEWNNGNERTVVHMYTSYDSPDLRSNASPSSSRVKDYIDEILSQVVTGIDYQDRIDALRAGIERRNSEMAQMKQREGKPFEFEKELEAAEKQVDEYTDLMKKELEEKEAKYANQQTEAVDLSKVENDDDDDNLYRLDEEFAEGQLFPIRTTSMQSSFDVLGQRNTYSTELMPDEYTSKATLLDAVRMQYPRYYATIDDDNIKMQSWSTVMAEAKQAEAMKKAKTKGTESYVQRKTRQVIDAVNDMANRMHVDVEVLTTTDGLTPKQKRAKGWFNPKTHRIVIVLPNHVNQSDVINTLLHEGVAHYGLRQMFGPHFEVFLDNVYNNVDPRIKAIIDASMKKHGWSRHEATEEYLARLAERTNFETALNSGWWRKIKEFFLDMLAKVGFDTTLTDNDLRYILWRSYDNLLHPDSRRSIFDKAQDVWMQNKLGVGQYSREYQPTGQAAESMVQEPVNEEYDEKSDIISKAKADGTYRKAPNGKPTNLNEDQWVMVRTKAFKDWFGDWENDPENASKVVDENGEPKVMYHGTNLDTNEGVPFYTFKPNQHFGTLGQAEEVSEGNAKVYSVFLNIRNPQRRNDANQDYLEDKDMSMSEYWELMTERAQGKGHDGIVYLNEYEDTENPADSWIAFNPNQIKSATDNNGDFSADNDDIRYSIRTKQAPKKTGTGYKVFVLKNGQLYPPMVANPNGEGTPIGMWLDADAAPIAGASKTGRPQVKAGGKGTQGGSGQLAYRPGWHLGTIPYALQFNRKDANGEKTLFPNNFVWAEVEYADDVDYNDEAYRAGVNENGKYQHSLAGLKHVPTDGSYMYRTNPNPETDPWIITGAMKVKKILSREEVDKLVREAGREPQKMQDGDVLDQQTLDELNAEIKVNEEADDMGLLYRSMTDNAQDIYNEQVAKKSVQFAEAWQDSMIGLKALQDAIAAETGNVATGAEDAYRFENRMHGRAKNMTEQYDWRFYRPMLKAFADFCKKHNMTQQQGIEYLVAKSGLERNVYYSFRNAMKKKVAEDLQTEREKLEKDYAKGKIVEATYKQMKADLQEKERTGVDDEMQRVRELLVYQRALEDYENGNIDYSEYLRRIEKLINANTNGYYQEAARDFSGLTETFAKEMYDVAQNVKKEAQRAIDPREKRELWSEYDDIMRQAYDQARQVAEDAVFSAETDTEETNKLWNTINAATKETLKTSYESGLIDRKGYDKVREMFNFYMPLRGWEEDKAADVYTYMGKDNVFSPAVKKTWGRTSKAENPLAYIGNIAVSTILSGHRNQLKQHFLNYVMNNPTNLVSISESWYENIGTEENPMWILRSADTAGKSADEIAQIVNDFNEEMQQKQAEGKAMPVRGRLRLDVNATQGQKHEHVVEVQRAGRTYQLYINGDPKAAQALNGTNAKAVSRISDTYLGKQITKLNRAMAMFFTSKNPAFVISNLSRDLNMAGASVAINEGLAYNAKFIENVAKVLSTRLATGDFSREGIKAVFGKGKGITSLMPKLMEKWMHGKLNEANETERYFKEFMDEGGETGFVNMLSVDSFKEKMQKEIREMNGSSLFGSNVKETTAGKGLRLIGEVFEFYNRCAEDATRFIVYMTSRQMGKSLEDSIADAKDVTLNFNRKGTGDKGNAEVRDLFIFVNPAIQALANMYRMAKGHPLKFGAVAAAFVAGGALMAIANAWALNMWGDDDDKDAYWNLPPWVRKNNLVFWLPGTKNFVTIPLAQEFRVFYGIGEMLMSASLDHPIHNPGLEIFSSVADLIPINPTGNGGNLMVDFAPTMVQPLMQVGENIDFTGKPIWRENQGNKYAPAYTKAYVSTPKYMVKIAGAMNSLTGGNEGKQGVIEKYSPIWGNYINNPAVWNHLLQGYFGGMYNTITKGFDVLTTTATGEMPKIYQTPVINRFLNRPVERDNAGALGDEYFKLIEDKDRLKFELRTWRKKAANGEEGAQEHVDEIMDSPEWKQVEVIDHYDKIMKDLRAGEKSATGEDKANIKRSISKYKQQLNEELNAISEGKDPLEAAQEQFDKATTFAERNKLRLRIERLMMQREGTEKNRTKSSDEDVAKALQYVDDDTVGKDANGRYLKLATADNIRDDARIKAVRSRLNEINNEAKRLEQESGTEAAILYQKQHAREINAAAAIESLTRTMNANKKLLGKGYDTQIMKLIDSNRRAILKQIENLE